MSLQSTKEHNKQAFKKANEAIKELYNLYPNWVNIKGINKLTKELININKELLNKYIDEPKHEQFT